MTKEKFILGRIAYLQTAIKRLRAEIAAEELATNFRLFTALQAVERHVREMEEWYAVPQSH